MRRGEEMSDMEHRIYYRTYTMHMGYLNGVGVEVELKCDPHVGELLQCVQRLCDGERGDDTGYR